jgi:hypothetical protein
MSVASQILARRIGLPRAQTHTGAGAHGLYPSRNAEFMYVSNR